MGHQVEYVIDLPPALATDWLSPVSLSCTWFPPEPPDTMTRSEFVWGGQCLHAKLGPTACFMSVPCIKYSWILDPSPSLDWVLRFEQWICETLSGVRAIRLDELLMLDWEREVGQVCWEIPDPVSALWAWLPTVDERYGDEYHRLLPTVRS